MISASHAADNFQYPVSYNDRKVKRREAKLLYTNIAASVRAAIIDEFDRVAARNPNVRRPALHVAISLPPGENLSDDEFRYVLQRYIEWMGFDRCQYAAWRDFDEPHEHIHITINRVTPSGAMISTRFNYRRQEKLMRELERHFGLRQLRSSKDIPISERRRKVSKIEKAIGTIWRVTRLAQIIHAVVDANSPASFAEIQNKLAEHGVRACLCSSRNKKPYVYYEFEGQSYNARNVDVASSLRGLVARGVVFVDRDAFLPRRYLPERGNVPVDFIRPQFPLHAGIRMESVVRQNMA